MEHNRIIKRLITHIAEVKNVSNISRYAGDVAEEVGKKISSELNIKSIIPTLSMDFNVHDDEKQDSKLYITFSFDTDQAFANIIAKELSISDDKANKLMIAEMSNLRINVKDTKIDIIGFGSLKKRFPENVNADELYEQAEAKIKDILVKTTKEAFESVANVYGFKLKVLKELTNNNSKDKQAERKERLDIIDKFQTICASMYLPFITEHNIDVDGRKYEDYEGTQFCLYWDNNWKEFDGSIAQLRLDMEYSGEGKAVLQFYIMNDYPHKDEMIKAYNSAVNNFAGNYKYWKLEIKPINENY